MMEWEHLGLGRKPITQAPPSAGGKPMQGIIGNVFGGIAKRARQSAAEDAALKGRLTNPSGAFAPVLDEINATGAVGGANAANLAASRNAQLGGVSLLEDAAMGRGPSLAQEILRQGGNQAAAAAASNAASLRGVAPAAAQRLAVMQGGEAQQAAAAGAAQLGLQEQQAARGQFVDALGQVRGADLGNAQLSAGLLTNTLGMQSQDELQRLQLETQSNLAAKQLAFQQQQLAFDKRRYKDSQPSGFEKTLGTIGKVTGVLGNIAGGIAGIFSDENLKEGIRDAGEDVDDFLDKLSPKAWKYKDGKRYGEGEHVGPMAQEFEASRLGKGMVEETPEGKLVKFDGRGLATLAAGAARLNQRLRKLEGLMGSH